MREELVKMREWGSYLFTRKIPLVKIEPIPSFSYIPINLCQMPLINGKIVSLEELNLKPVTREEKHQRVLEAREFKRFIKENKKRPNS